MSSWLGVRYSALLALVLASSVAGLGLVMSPVLVSNWISLLGITPTQAGGLITIELLTSSASAIYISRWIGDSTLTLWLLVGMLTVALANITCIYLTTFTHLSFARGVSGVGSGIVYGIFAASVAATSLPERLYGTIAVLQGLILATALIFTPSVITTWGLDGLYVCMASISAMAILSVALWPKSNAQPSEFVTNSVTHRGYALLGGAFAVSLTGMGIWSFSQQLGLRSGLSEEMLGLVLGLSTLAGLGGAALAAAMGAKFGRLRPLVLGTLIVTISMACLVAWPDETVFVVTQCTWALSFYFLSPFILGQAAMLDRHGRLAAITGGAINLGAAAGPVLFGSLFVAGLTLEAIMLAGTVTVALFVYSTLENKQTESVL